MSGFSKIIGIALMLCILTSCESALTQPSRIARGDIAPDFQLESLAGKTVKLSSFKGRDRVLLVFWATWCPYCVEEIPELIEVKNKLGDKGVEVIGIDIQESKEKVSSFAARHDINYTVVLDKDGKAADAYGVYGIPTAIIVDKDGIVRFRGSSPKGGFMKFLEDMLEE